MGASLVQGRRPEPGPGCKLVPTAHPQAEPAPKGLRALWGRPAPAILAEASLRPNKPRRHEPSGRVRSRRDRTRTGGECRRGGEKAYRLGPKALTIGRTSPVRERSSPEGTAPNEDMLSRERASQRGPKDLSARSLDRS